MGQSTAYNPLMGGMKKTKKNGQARAGPRRPFAKKRFSSVALKMFSALAYFIAIILGIIVLVGCVSPPMQSLYAAEFSSGDKQLRVGYFGACASIGTGETVQTHCVANMKGHENDDISEELWEDMDDGAQGQLQSFLMDTIPQAKNLQKNVFSGFPSIFHLVLFVISGAMLFVAVTNQTGKPGYKWMLVTTVLMAGAALTMVYLAAIGGLVASNALVFKGGLVNGFTFVRAHRLYYVQVAQAILVTFFYISMGGMFIQG